jgi:hypothetical protein
LPDKSRNSWLRPISNISGTVPAQIVSFTSMTPPRAIVVSGAAWPFAATVIRWPSFAQKKTACGLEQNYFWPRKIPGLEIALSWPGDPVYLKEFWRVESTL